MVNPAFRVIEPPLPLRVPTVSALLTTKVPPLTVIAAVSAIAEPPLRVKVPELTTASPENVLAPVKAREPDPAFVSPNPAPEITPPTVKVPPLTVICRLAFITTAPVPRFRFWVPVKAKSPFQFCVLLLRVTDPAVVLSRIPPVIVSVPVPAAAALLRLIVPALRVSPPPKVFAPERVSAPDPSLVTVPVLVAIGSATVMLPAPPKVRFWVPVIALPLATSRLRVPASELIRVVPANVTAPETVLSPLTFRKAPPELTPVPVRFKASAVLMPPVSSSAPPLFTAVLPAVVPSALLWLARRMPPLLTVVVPL